MTDSALDRARREAYDAVRAVEGQLDRAPGQHAGLARLRVLRDAIARLEAAAREDGKLAALKTLARIEANDVTIEEHLEGTDIRAALTAMIAEREAAARLAGIDEGMEKASLLAETLGCESHYVTIVGQKKQVPGCGREIGFAIRQERDRLRGELAAAGEK